jgi:hypothetical protein
MHRLVATLMPRVAVTPTVDFTMTLVQLRTTHAFIAHQKQQAQHWADCSVIVKPQGDFVL